MILSQDKIKISSVLQSFPFSLKQEQKKPEYRKAHYPCKRQLKMSTFLWTTERAQYVVDRFDAGVAPAQILAELQSTGYTTLRLFTIEQCLRTNGRAVDGFDPLIRPSFTSNTFDAQGYRGQPNTYAGDTFVRGGSTATKPPYHPPSNFRPQSSRERRWDQAADRYAINAHREGRTVMEIWEELNRNGYVSNAAEVAASLNAQGVSSVRITDYLRR